MLLETLAGDSFKCSKDHQNFRNLWIIFFARQVETALFKWRPLRPKCLLVIFLLSSISMCKSNKWLSRFLTVSVALRLPDLIVGLENITSVLGKVSLIRVFCFRSLSKISLDVERVASFVPMWTMMCFAKDWMYMIIEIIHSSSREFPYSNVMLFRKIFLN